jgi:hypothetical protein
MSFARPNRPVVGDKFVQRAIRRQEERGQKHPDVTKILARQLAKDRGLSANVVNNYNEGKYPTGKYGSMGAFGAFADAGEDLDKKYGRGTKADIAGLQGAKLGRGDVYMGATEVGPATEGSDFTRYTDGVLNREVDRTIVPSWMVQQKPQSGSAAAPAQQVAPASTQPSPGLTKAREAYDRANQYQQESANGGSFAGRVVADLSKTGSDLYTEINRAGNAGVQAYNDLAIPQLQANASLTAHEIGYAAQNAIANLPLDLRIPEYDEIFGKKNERKIREGGVFGFLGDNLKRA